MTVGILTDILKPFRSSGPVKQPHTPIRSAVINPAPPSKGISTSAGRLNPDVSQVPQKGHPVKLREEKTWSLSLNPYAALERRRLVFNSVPAASEAIEERMVSRFLLGNMPISM